MSEHTVLAGCVLQSDDLWTATGDDDDAATSATFRGSLYRLDVMSYSRRSPNGLRYDSVAIKDDPGMENNRRGFDDGLDPALEFEDESFVA